jgi:hypothetical protein
MADSTPNAKSSFAVTALWLAVLTALIGAFWFTVLVYMPMQKKKFDEFGLLLPSMSKTAMDIATVLNNVWLVGLPVMFVVVLGGIVMLRHGLDAAKGGILYALVMAIFLSGAIGFFLISILIPLRKLLEGLSK